MATKQERMSLSGLDSLAQYLGGLPEWSTFIIYYHFGQRKKFFLRLAPGLSEFGFLTYPVPFKWTEWNLKKLFPVYLILCNLKNTVPVSWAKITIQWQDQTSGEQDWMRYIFQYHLSHSISFIKLNLIYTDEISINLIQKLKNKLTIFN